MIFWLFRAGGGSGGRREREKEEDKQKQTQNRTEPRYITSHTTHTPPFLSTSSCVPTELHYTTFRFHNEFCQLHYITCRFENQLCSYFGQEGTEPGTRHTDPGGFLSEGERGLEELCKELPAELRRSENFAAGVCAYRRNHW